MPRLPPGRFFPFGNAWFLTCEIDHRPEIDLIRVAILSNLLLTAVWSSRCTLPISAVDSIPLALEHTKQQLFKPFRISQWTKLAFVGLLARELGANGFNRSNFNLHPHPGVGPHIALPAPLGIEHALLAGFVASAVVASLAVGIILMYVSSVMRFVLFDSIILRECHIRWGWSRRLGPGWKYFVWKLLYLLLILGAIAIFIGIPLAVVFANGWFRAPKEHLAPLVLGGIFLFFVFFVFFVATALIFVLTKDFVIPRMALENVDVMEGWRRLWPMMGAEKGAYVAYVVMKIVLAIIVGILTSVATLILGLIIAVPSVALGILAVLTGKSAGMTWNAQTIALAVVIGAVLLAVFLYLVSLIYVPAIVFFPAYSIYFFAARYPRLNAALFPPNTPTPVPAGAFPPGR